MSPRAHEQTVGAEAVQARTGRSRDAWYALLDEAGAQRWSHADIARWLVEQHAVDGWWAQSIAVGYEQARGMRLPGQRADGTFEATASVTLTAHVEHLFTLLTDPGPRSRWLDVEPVEQRTTPPRSVRWHWPDGSRVALRLTPQAGGKVRLAVQHQRLTGADQVRPAKEAWAARLRSVRDLVSETG